MPLSEYEQRVLEQMERQLSADDPKLATSLTAPGRRSGAKVLVSAVAVVVGILLLVVGVAVSQPVVGILGFAVMFGGVAYAILGPSGHHRTTGPLGAVAEDGTVRPRAARPGGRQARREGFMNRLEERWDKRRDEGL